MEEFRPWVERLALTLVNRGELKPAHFVVRDGGAVELTEPARKLLVAAYQQRKSEEIAHPLFREKVRYAQFIFIQARLLARALRDGVAYEPYIFT
jgi:CRISPR-associated protein Cas1